MTIVEYFKHGDQTLRDQIAWHRANGNQLTEYSLEVYAAGFRQAWAAARADIALHGVPRE